MKLQQKKEKWRSKYLTKRLLFIHVFHSFMRQTNSRHLENHFKFNQDKEHNKYRQACPLNAYSFEKPLTLSSSSCYLEQKE